METSEILPRVEIFESGPHDWRYRLVAADGTVGSPEGGPGVWGRPMVALRHAFDAYPDMPLIVIATEPESPPEQEAQ